MVRAKEEAITKLLIKEYEDNDGVVHNGLDERIVPPRPEGRGWRLVSHAVSVSRWAYGEPYGVLFTFSWERNMQVKRYAKKEER